MRYPLHLLILLFIVIGCDRQPQTEVQSNAETGRRIRIVVTSEPLLAMTKAIIGDVADVLNVVPDDVSSLDWNPTAKEAVELQQADLILISGAGYEPWKDRVSLPGSRLKDTAAGYYDQFIRIPDAITHQHGPGGAHSHPGTVWGTWLDPELCAAQLHAVTLQCSRLLPDHKTTFETAEAKLAAELNGLNADIASIQKHVADSFDKDQFTVFADAPHYYYLTNRLEWTLNYQHWSPDDSLSESERATLVDALSKTGEGPRIFLMDSRRSAATEDFVRDAGGTPVRIDTCEFPSPDGTKLPARLKANLQRILKALSVDPAANTVRIAP